MKTLARFPSFSLGGRESSILDGLQGHLSTVKQCVTTYQKMVSAYATGQQDARKYLDEVFNLETEADGTKRDSKKRIAEGAFFGGVREDILTLIEADDDIADAAKDAARLLSIGAEEDEAFRNLLKSDHMSGFQEKLLAAVTSLESLIQTLQIDKDAALSRVHAVEDCEEQADTEKNLLLTQLFKRPRSLDPVTIIELRDFIFASDDIADNAEKASDLVLVLVAKGYG